MRKLISGVSEFVNSICQYAERFRELALVQSPDTLMITCSDSRVVPDPLASTDPGDLLLCVTSATDSPATDEEYRWATSPKRGDRVRMV
jgi:carbonic anhydrase